MLPDIWPEQEAVEAWWNRHRHELKVAASKFRIAEGRDHDAQLFALRTERDDERRCKYAEKRAKEDAIHENNRLVAELAALRAQLARLEDEEGVAKALYAENPLFCFPYSRILAEWDNLSNDDKKPYIKEARAFIRYVKEGK